MSALGIAKDVLAADATVTGYVSTRIGPLLALQNTAFPYAVLTETTTEPVNDLGGHSGLDRCEVQVEIWARTVLDAEAIAAACRAAMETAGHICLSRSSESADVQVDPGAFRSGFLFQVWI